jgi:hypothetical protein
MAESSLALPFAYLMIVDWNLISSLKSLLRGGVGIVNSDVFSSLIRKYLI